MTCSFQASEVQYNFRHNFLFSASTRTAILRGDLNMAQLTVHSAKMLFICTSTTIFDGNVMRSKQNIYNERCKEIYGSFIDSKRKA